MRPHVTTPLPTSPQVSNHSQMSRGIFWASAALVCAAVTACGGGGGAGVGGNTTNTGNTNANTDNTSIAGSWAPQAYAKASNAAASDSFGTSVAISDDTMVVGAPGEDSNQTTITNGSTASTDNSASSAGAAYVFVRSGSAWSQQAYLKAPNAGVSDNFGSSIAISGDTVVVGAPLEESNQTTITNGSTASTDNSASSAGAAYVFVRSGNTW
ncbi:MAG: FG-GAP repeat protein, partial [Rhodoferax sp.]